MSDSPESGKHPIKEKISGLGQKIIGEIESIGGILTGDPNTAAEGEFNVEIGTVREELEDNEERNQGDAEAEN
ncbi:MAG TPA: hypothetical protein VJL58_07275 [Pyrinomonadaceae bacterium]|nr:hypothetical protein [Pyrinomonadaceae bacterium]